MKYRNKKTGQVVITTGRVWGGDWERISDGPGPGTSELKVARKPEAPKPKGKKK